jgi:hypothetical protein
VHPVFDRFALQAVGAVVQIQRNLQTVSIGGAVGGSGKAPALSVSTSRLPSFVTHSAMQAFRRNSPGGARLRAMKPEVSPLRCGNEAEHEEKSQWPRPPY